MEPPGEAWPALVDASRPNNARVYDYLLGGKDNYAADRDLGEKLETEAPGLRKLAGTNRAFVLKGARWAGSMLGIGQFLDLGCGLPSHPAVHDAARGGCEGARVVYVDRDPVVFSHVGALQAGPGLAAVKADVAGPARVLELVAVLRVPGGGKLIDFARPACVILGGTLSAMGPDVAREAVKGYAAALAKGSAIVISCVSYEDAEFGDRMAAMFTEAGPWRNHSRETVCSFFTGLRLIEGDIGPVLPGQGAPAAVIGGVGVRD